MNTAWRNIRPIQRVAIFVTCFVLVAGLTAFITSRASATSDKICQPGGHADLGCLTNKQLASRFKHHEIHHAHGFTPAAVFKNPKRFRKLAHTKMASYLRHHPKAEHKLRAKFLTKRDSSCTDNCLAWKMYGQLMAHSNCSPQTPVGYSPYTCQPAQTGHRKAAIRGVTVAYCGGALILGAVGAFSSDGAAAPAAATIYGGIGCGWGFMSSFFN